MIQKAEYDEKSPKIQNYLLKNTFFYDIFLFSHKNDIILRTFKGEISLNENM